jgi:hypothetical protein
MFDKSRGVGGGVETAVHAIKGDSSGMGGGDAISAFNRRFSAANLSLTRFASSKSFFKFVIIFSSVTTTFCEFNHWVDKIRTLLFNTSLLPLSRSFLVVYQRAIKFCM